MIKSNRQLKKKLNSVYKEEKKLLKSVQFSNWDVGVQASIIELLIGENLIYIHDMVLLANGEEEHFY